MTAESDDIQKGNGRSRRGAEWKIFAFCVFVAFILWLLTALNENYTSNIRVRVHYFNTPKDKVYIRPLPEDFRLVASAKGWDMLVYSMSHTGEHIYIDLNDFKNQQYILSRRLKVHLQQQVSHKLSIQEIYPDTIFLSTAPRMVKKVPVKLKLHIDPMPQYNLGDIIKFSPDSVEVTGPSSLIRKISEVETRSIYLNGLKEPTTVNAVLNKPPFENISYSVDHVTAIIPIYQLSEQRTTVKIHVINLPEDINIKLIPESITLIYQTTLNQYNNVDVNSFEAVVDGSKLDTTKIVPLKVDVISKPPFIYNLRIRPEHVNYVIKK